MKSSPGFYLLCKRASLTQKTIASERIDLATVNGIIIVDKPAGWTSHDVVAKLRGALRVKRIGHGGTLDPMATGVLPVFAGRATRAAGFSENADKEYIAGLRLGVVTDTQDITGNVISEACASVSVDELADMLLRFEGWQKQIPPMYSAIKRDGKKLYELARRGVEVPREARDVNISRLELVEGAGSEFLLRIVCSKGTYIRTLCHDVGAALGCGGTMSSLRRTRAGVFTIESAHTLDSILTAVAGGAGEGMFLPVDTIFSEFPAVTLSSGDAEKCRHGASLKLAHLSDGRYRFYAPDGGFLMLGEAGNGAVKVVKSFYSLEQD